MATLTYPSASYTHVGRRRSNQDSVLVRRLATGDDLIAVADGMGGHSAGEVASSIVLEALVDGLEGGASLETATMAANARVYGSAMTKPEWQGMGTTLVVLLRSGQSYSIANVGDSRAYVIDSAGIRQITEDHSYVAEALRAGTITAAEAARSPWRNALTRAIGTDSQVAVDIYGPFVIDRPHVVLLCSDGLYKTVGEDLILEYVMSIDDLPAAAEALTALAYRRGSDDNITVAALEFAALTRRPPSVTLPIAIQFQGSVVRPPIAEAEPAPVAREPARARSGPMPAAPVASALPTVHTDPSPARTASSEDELVLASLRRKRRRKRKRREDTRLKVLLAALIVLAVLAGAAGWWWSALG